MPLTEFEASLMNRHGIDVPKEKIAEFCHCHHIRKLALFGSVLREDFRPDSDVDVLVEFRVRPHGRIAWHGGPRNGAF